MLQFVLKKGIFADTTKVSKTKEVFKDVSNSEKPWVSLENNTIRKPAVEISSTPNKSPTKLLKFSQSNEVSKNNLQGLNSWKRNQVNTEGVLQKLPSVDASENSVSKCNSKQRLARSKNDSAAKSTVRKFSSGAENSSSSSAVVTKQSAQLESDMKMICGGISAEIVPHKEIVFKNKRELCDKKRKLSSDLNYQEQRQQKQEGKQVNFFLVNTIDT